MRMNFFYENYVKGSHPLCFELEPYIGKINGINTKHKECRLRL